MLKNVFAGILLLALVSCGHGSSNSKEAPKLTRGFQEHNIMSTLWARHSGEFQALGYQAYHTAQIALDNALRKKVKKPAVVADLDETVLDNIEFQIRNIAKDQSYTPEAWTQWVNEARAGAIAGAVDFFKYAASKGVDIYYVSNRKINEVEATFKNLNDLGLPAKKENLLFRDKEKSKEGRRQSVQKTHGYVLFIGDNLIDFSNAFDDKSSQERKATVHNEKSHFGVDYIILPNPMYGSWEDVFYETNPRMGDAEKAAKRFEWLNKN